jgi:MerR family transcriptional regulator, copper efflux regulator
MKIGEIASQTGVSAKMIRHYEAIGLIAAGARRTNGYRDYGTQDIHELRFIRRARDLGFPLDEIRALLDLWRDRSRQSHHVHELASRHLGDINRKINELKAVAETLQHLVTACHDDARPSCPILDGLAAR